jgi:hypothetical protein
MRIRELAGLLAETITIAILRSSWLATATVGNALQGNLVFAGRRGASNS